MRYINLLLSKFYYIVIAFRYALYQLKIFKTHQFNIPVISVGNLTVGGSCKTPMVEYLSHILNNKRMKPCIVTRGYKRKHSGELVVAHNNQASIDDVGDEAYMLSKKNLNTPIVVANNKISAVEYAIKNLDIDCIILDDGFQSLYIKKDVDIVMVNSLLRYEDYQLFPLGRAREKIKAINRADMVITTKNNLADNADDSLFRMYNSNIINSEIIFSIIEGGSILTKETSASLDLISVCGIADPDSFTKGLSLMGVKIKIKKIFSDHHHYLENDVSGLTNDIESNDCDGIITTEKDYYKINILNPPFKIYVMKMEMKLNDDELLNTLNKIL